MKALKISLFLIVIAVLVYALTKKPHQFASTDCGLCHFDVENDPFYIKTNITSACDTCHSEINKIQSHPTDIYSVLSIPDDMPLTNGKLTCITCHYIHPEKREFSRYFLRRPVSGVIFCSTCHKINEKRHIVFENVHSGIYRETSRQTRIDNLSLTCIQCHDTYIDEPTQFLGAGVWRHFPTKLNHPIGVSYKKISHRRPRDFRPTEMLPKEIRLFNGKIGCCTCHNIYSKERFKLVIDNRYSKLCLECHIK
jgi:hypothetical protein